MKCTNCGKNNASYHYRYSLNGQVTEAHLCAECAAKLEPEREFAAKSREMFGGFFDEGFFGGASRMLDSFFTRDPFEEFFGRSLFGSSPFAALGMPRIEISFPNAAGPDAKPESGGSGKVDPELSKKREINALREQMRAAAEAEDYEKAAELRDKLRDMEKGSD